MAPVPGPAPFLLALATVFIAGGCVALGELFTETPWQIMAVTASFAPCVLFVLLHTREDPGAGVFLAGPWVMVMYAVFFLFHGLHLAFSGRGDAVMPIVSWGAMQKCAFTLTGIGAAMLCFTAGYFLPAGGRLARLLPGVHSSGGVAGRCFWLGVVLLGLASLGQAILVAENGGIPGLVDRYLMHVKLYTAGTVEKLGLMLWHTLYGPGIWLLAVALAETPAGATRAVRGWIVAVVVLSVSSMAVLLFGSRMQLLNTLVGFSFIYHWRIARISPARMALAVPFLVALSVGVVSYRTGTPMSDFRDLSVVSANLGHGVFDVFLALEEEPSAILPADVSYLDRWLQFPLWLVPRVLWPGKPLMTELRIDWYVASHFNPGESQVSTGYPASMFAEWFVLAGWYGVFAGAFLFGTAVGVLDRWFRRQADRPLAILVYVPVVLSCLHYFKDGDLFMSGLSFVKAVVLSAVIVAWLGGRLERGLA